MIESNLICSSCGTAEWEWENDRFAYSPYSHICPGCEKRDLMTQDPDRDKLIPGETVRLKKRES